MLEFLAFDIFNILNLIGHASLFANWEHHPHDGAKYDEALNNLYLSCFIRKSTFLCFFNGFMGLEGVSKVYYSFWNILWGAFWSVSSLFRHFECISIICFDHFVARFLNVFCLFWHSFLFTFGPLGTSLHIAKCLHRSQTKNVLAFK